jgi:hypothetical protein
MWDASAAGNQIGPTLTFDGAGGNPPAVTVTSGLFSLTLDFGAGSINGEGRWLRVEVICQNDPNYPTYATLSPRVELKPTPHALALPGLYTLENATSPNLIGGYAGNTVGASIVGATIAGGGQFVGPQSVTANFGTIGGGDANTVSDVAATVAGGGSNTASALAATVIGGGSNVASGWASTAGGWQNVASGDFSTVGGGADNTASGLAATVGGGSNGNRAQGDQSTVGGGGSNVAAGLASTIVTPNSNVAMRPRNRGWRLWRRVWGIDSSDVTRIT